MAIPVETIFVELLNEGVPCWRPVSARRISSDSFEITDDLDPAALDEVWEFQPGDRVVCEQRAAASGGLMLAATRTAPKQR